MAFYRKSPEADDDLLRIWRYIAEDNRATATQFIDRLHGTMGTLAEMPGMGRPRDDLAPGLRTFPLSAYLIIYREVTGGIEVARVLSARRDHQSIFSDS